MVDEEDIREIKREIDNLREELENTEKKLEKKIYKNGDRFTRDLGKAKSRISELEKELGIEDYDTRSFHGHSTKMSRITLMEEEERKEELNKSLFRASIVWEKFDEWSKYTSNGRVIKSGELRTHLSNYLSKEKFSWEQTYRVMKSFENNTSDAYFEEDRENMGRVLVRDPTRNR